MKDGWVRPALVSLASIALLALIYPIAWTIQDRTGAQLVPAGPYAILAVFGSGVISVAAFVLAIAVAMLGATRRRDRSKASVQSFE